MNSTRLPLALALAALPFVSQAQESSLPDVVVSAQKTGNQTLNASSQSAASLAPLVPATSDAASLLRDIPGVSLYGAGGVSSLPAIHGMADDRVRTKVDGMDLVAACPNHMNSPLSYVDPTSVGSVKVFAGITPVSVGGDSIGGTIVVDAPAPEFAEPGKTLLKGQAGAFYRSNGDGHGGNIGATLAGENVSVTYAGSTAQASDYKAARDFKPAWPATDGRADKAADVVESTAYKSENQSLGVAVRHENHVVDFKYGVQRIPYEAYPNQRMDMTQNDSTQLNLRYRGRYAWGALEARIYDEKTEHKMDFGDDKQYWYTSLATCQAAGFVLGSTTCAAGMPMNTEGKNTGVSLKADIAVSERDIVRVGGEYQRYRLNDWWPPSGRGMWPNTFWNINGGQRDRTDVYAEWEARWTPQWLSQVGLRSDTVDMDAGTISGYSTSYATDANRFNSSNRAKTDHNWDLTALARYMPDGGQTYEIGYARKTRSPNLYERYTWSTGGMAMVMNNFVGDGNGYIGNLDLKPEVAHTLSATAEWHDAAGERWGLKATPYYTQIDDYIDARRCPTSLGGSCSAANLTKTDGFVYLQYVNQSAHVYGIDLSGHVPLGQAAGYGSFTGTGVLSYVRGKNDTTGDNLYDIMPVNARLAVVHHLGGWSNTAELQLVSAKTDISQVRNEVRTAGYALVNLRSSYEWKQLRLDLGIENLFDRFYNPPLGGAYLGQWKTMSAAGTPYGVPVPGPARSVYAAVNVKF